MSLRNGFDYLENFDIDADACILYASAENFTGNIVPGYEANLCILSEMLGKKLEIASQIAAKKNFRFKIFEAYRPLRAGQYFFNWALGEENSMKQIFYPNISKEEILKQEYIIMLSSHSRGAAVDLTLIDKTSGREVDMGTCFDLFDEKSHSHSEEISVIAQKNRKILLEIMEQAGFVNYEKEWWHFALKNEPFPDQYFDFPIKYVI